MSSSAIPANFSLLV
ncbi:Unc-45 family protein, partial [Phytophthora megakarya]